MLIEAVSEPASILVVDDNPLIIGVLKSVLLSQNYNVYTSNNGEEALELLGRKCVDVIICDVMMPKMDGYQFHSMVRQNPEFSHISFLFLSALGEHSEVCRGKEIGADEYLVKPFDPKDLLAIVKGKIRRSQNLKNLSEQRYEAYRKRVIHTLSHEFRTPLVAINTGTELLIEQRENLDVTKSLHLLEAIQRGGQRLERLVADFMLLQQVEAGISRRLFDTRSKLHSLSDLVDEYVAGRVDQLKMEGFELVFDNHGDDVEVQVYKPQIHDVLNRLVSNAMKFSPTSPSIEIHLVPLDKEVAIEVRDRGIGLDVDRVNEAIDIFGQIDRERLEQQGGGLGLAIANRYAGINGGRLDFENRDGGGSIVSLILPLPDAEDPESQQHH